jgi:hypothetical protein
MPGPDHSPSQLRVKIDGTVLRQGVPTEVLLSAGRGNTRGEPVRRAARLRLRRAIRRCAPVCYLPAPQELLAS